MDLMRDLANGGRQVCVKQTSLTWSFAPVRPKAPDRPWHEVAILGQLSEEKCQWVSELYGVFMDGEHLYVVTSWAVRGDLFAWSAAQKEQPGPRREALVAPLAVQVVLAAQHLHGMGLAHRDISPENLVLDEAADGELRVRLIDFGMATFSRWARGSEVAGKVSYRAPEMQLAEAYDTLAADAFAVGVTIFLVSANDYPWLSTKRGVCESFTLASDRGFSEWLATRRLRGGRRLSDVFSQQLVQVLRGLLHFEREVRLTLGEPGIVDASSPRRASVCECRWLSIKGKPSDPCELVATPTLAYEDLKLSVELTEASTCAEGGSEAMAAAERKPT